MNELFLRMVIYFYTRYNEFHYIFNYFYFFLFQFCIPIDLLWQFLNCRWINYSIEGASHVFWMIVQARNELCHWLAFKTDFVYCCEQRISEKEKWKERKKSYESICGWNSVPAANVKFNCSWNPADISIFFLPYSVMETLWRDHVTFTLM